MFYEDKTVLETAGQILISGLFLVTLIINATTKVKQHVDRMREMAIPYPLMLLWIGFLIQAIGGTLLILDLHTNIGASLLIVFTIAASIIFHRFWNVREPLRRHLHLSFIFSNCAIVGALLLLV
ncbi:MAG: DoxX family protein [Rhodospirillaceae bacterium]|nr:DoxX family protein [Rhodospirillaceae bacterium]